MAFDPVTSSLILFGGYGDGTLDDTWKWEGTAWRRLSPTSSPPPLAGASLAFSAAVGKLILFGGERHATGAGGPATTWTWDGINWSELAFASSPSGRAFAAMAADPAGRLILLFGGLANGSLLGDTWTLTSVWSADTRSAAPPPRAYSSLVADPSSNSLLLFGGESASGRMGDTWAWSTF